MRALYESIESCLKPLQMVAKFGLPVVLKDGETLFLHLLLDFHAADLPNTEGLLGMKRGPQVITPYHTYLAKREDFLYSKSAEYQTLRHSKEVLNSTNKLGNINTAENCIRTLSMHPGFPMLN